MKFKTIFKWSIYILFFVSLYRVKKFKNLHKGESVYILADSAVIKHYDLELFEDKPMISFNRSSMIHKVKNRKNKTYFVFGDPYFFYNKLNKLINPDEINYLGNFFKKTRIPVFLNLTNILGINSNNIYYTYRKLPFDSYTKDLIKLGIKPFSWSGSIAVSIAVYMGFKEIILVGVSNHTYSYKNHWYFYGTVPYDTDYEPDRGRLGYDMNLLRKYSILKTMVPTKKSSSQIDFVVYEDYFDTKIQYNENYNLVDYEFLNIIENRKNKPI